MALRIFVDISAPEDTLQLLRNGAAGHEMIFSSMPAASVLAQAELDPQLLSADIAFGQPDPEAIVKAHQLKWIQVSSSSITRYDSPKFRQLVANNHIAVCNSASVYSEACAEHALAFLLAQSRLLPRSLETHVSCGSEAWHQLRGGSVALRGQTALILGYGAIGKRLSELLRPFDMNVIGVRRRPRGDETVPIIGEHQLAGALSRADHVINILPDSTETRHFFDRARFAALQTGAAFYNIGRGTTVDQNALLDALRSGRLKAAWLDVTDPEPLPDGHPLLAEPSCFITPHVAGGHRDESKTLVRHFLANLGRFVRSEPLLDQVM
jgi:phosphoglycerate dehydrogenase-like enzyme